MDTQDYLVSDAPIHDKDGQSFTDNEVQIVTEALGLSLEEHGVSDEMLPLIKLYCNLFACTQLERAVVAMRAQGHFTAAEYLIVRAFWLKGLRTDI